MYLRHRDGAIDSLRLAMDFVIEYISLVYSARLYSTRKAGLVISNLSQIAS